MSDPLCSKIAYGGVCIIGSNRYTYSRAAVSDAKGISDIYQPTGINLSNYRQKLSDTDPSRFEKKGGMFIVMNEAEIADEIRRPDSFWAVFRDEGGRVVGSFWFSERNEYYHGLKYEHMENCIYPREVAVSRQHGGNMIAQALYYTCAKAFLSVGYKRGAADLYRVIRYETADGVFVTDQTNLPSKRAVEAIGAVFAEPLPIRTIRLDGLTVTIEPQMYLFDYARIIKNCEKLFADKAIQLIGGIGNET